MKDIEGLKIWRSIRLNFVEISKCAHFIILIYFFRKHSNNNWSSGSLGLAFANLKKISCDTWWVLHKNSRFIQVPYIFLNTCTFKNLQSHAWNIVLKVWFFITQLKLNLNVLLSTLFTAIQLKAIWVKYLCDY